jgi:hypothetical protein
MLNQQVKRVDRSANGKECFAMIRTGPQAIFKQEFALGVKFPL